MKTIKNLLSLAVFMVGAFKAVCVVDGCACLKSEGGALRLEMRFTDKEPAKNVDEWLVEKPLPPHRAIVTPAGKSSL